MNNIVYFEIQSSDLSRDIHFYQTVFGWKFTQVEGLPIEYYQIETENMSGGLLKRPAGIPPIHCGTNAYTCSVLVENFDETSKKILQAGGQVAMAKFAIPGRCWQGYFLDLDQNTFGLVEADEKAQ
ncbi:MULTISPECIES: VOC family protein [unclassified Acinetobacter]|uniref:VOC family protein n=1 Tax=unclassified Acinetobacter TaxID=196816 RepID=UPI0012214255|nr:MULTISPECIES: VOC family protein [unclassified Acinetobacter]RZJ23276.1 MAG: VOC family protein [Acinetobacter sp.]